MGKTFVSILLDESGSMQSVRDQVIDGFNEYISGLVGSEVKRIRVSLTKFDSSGFNPDYVGAKLKNVPELTRKSYKPNAMTPLYDAVGRMVRALEQQVANDSIKQGDKVLVVIQTDGYENASKEYTKKAIKKLLKEKQKAGWTFVFLGADQNAWGGASDLGVTKWNTIAYHSIDTQQIWGDQLVTATASYAVGTPGSAVNFFAKNSADESLNTTAGIMPVDTAGADIVDTTTSNVTSPDVVITTTAPALPIRTVVTGDDGEEIEI